MKDNFVYISRKWNIITQWTYDECESARVWHQYADCDVSTLKDGGETKFMVLIPEEYIDRNPQYHDSSFGYVRVNDNIYLHIDTVSFKNWTTMGYIKSLIADQAKYPHYSIIYPL